MNSDSADDRRAWRTWSGPPLLVESAMRFLLIFALAASTFAADLQLKATPSTVAWGYYWSQAKPVLRIKSGDRVEIETMLTNSPDRLAAAGVKPEEIESALKAIYAEVPKEAKGPG